MHLPIGGVLALQFLHRLLLRVCSILCLVQLHRRLAERKMAIRQYRIVLFRHLVQQGFVPHDVVLPHLAALVPAVLLAEVDSLDATRAQVGEIVGIRMVLPLQASAPSLARPPLILTLFVVSHTIRLSIAFEEEPSTDVGLVQDGLVQVLFVQELYVGQLAVLDAQVVSHVVPPLLLRSHELLIILVLN